MQYQRMVCKLIKSRALLQELCSVGWCVSLGSARSSVLPAQHKLLPKLQQAGTRKQSRESTTGQVPCWGWGCWTGTKHFSSQHFGYFTRGQHLHIKPNNLFQQSKCTCVWMEQSGQWALRLPSGGGGTGQNTRKIVVSWFPATAKCFKYSCFSCLFP